ncbi:choice-of-anchor I family protein [Roseibacillus persicicus]|uniref:choice-of-anchor I family protein n=1 Tax=Roseibacillus persicicus TaxID=454148 RepID=UPI00398B444E
MATSRVSTLLTACLGTVLFSSSASAQSGLLVTELKSNGDGGDFWELTNVGGSLVDLTGWSWDDDSAVLGTIVIPDGTTIAPGESLIFTGVDEAEFRAYWNLDAAVQVLFDEGAPGLGGGDAINLFDATELVLTFSYDAEGFTKSDGSPAEGGHAGLSAGGSLATQSLVLDPLFGTENPRYTFADGFLNGTVSPAGDNNAGSPGSAHLDYTGPDFELSLTVAPPAFSESSSDSVEGTVTRTGDTTEELVVNLFSGDITEATVPASVTIPAGQAAAVFAVTPADDAFPDGDQTFDLTAMAAGGLPATFSITVEDDGDTFSQRLMLTEVLSNQSDTAPDGAEDYWELTNFGAVAVDLSGYSWHDSGRDATTAADWALPEGSSIASGESVIFTETDPTVFRQWWGLDESVQVFQAVGGPGLGKGDGVSFFDAGGNEIFFFSYAVGDFALENGDPSFGEDPVDPNNAEDPGHAGIASGGVEAFQAAVWVPSSGFDAPRYTAATGSNYGTFTGLDSEDLGSPGRLGAAVDLSIYVRVGRYDLPEPSRTTAPTDNLLAEEASGVAYNWDTDSLFLVGDGGQSVTEVSKTGELLSTMTLALGSSPQGTDFYDPEGITYIGNGEFVFTEERDRQLVKFTYVAGATLTRADTEVVKIGTFVPNIGTEGLSFDPLTGGFVVLREKDPIGIFQTEVDFENGTASNGSATTEDSVNLFDPALLGMTDVADVFALSNLPNRYAGSLLVLGQEDGRVVHIDRAGNVLSTLNIASDPGNPLSVADQQHEGIVMDHDGFIYIVNENGGGSIDRPQLWVYKAATGPNQAPTEVALNNAVTSVIENTNTQSGLKVADIIITDDGLGSNEVTVSGVDADFFEVVNSELFVKAGTSLDFETQSSYSISIEVDDVTVGGSPDASVPFTLVVTDLVDETVTGPVVIVSEVAPWSSGNSEVGADWFELTNTSDSTIDLTGWKMDDNSDSFGQGAFLEGVTSIAPGESVVFIDGALADLESIGASFLSNWFGESAPAGLQIGTYDGPGLGTGGDAVNIYDASGALQTRLAFGPSPEAAPFATFDNSAGLDEVEITFLSEEGRYGAFLAANGVEIGSPGTTGALIISEVAPWSSGRDIDADWFEVTNLTAREISIEGWSYDDNSESSATAVPLHGITTLAAGESVIFIEANTPEDLESLRAEFLSLWFGDQAPAALQIGSYSGSGIGLSGNGDAVNLFDSEGNRRANVFFGASPEGPYATFDNAAGLEQAELPRLSIVGLHGAFAAFADQEQIGSPGRIQGLPVPTEEPEKGYEVLTALSTATLPRGAEIGAYDVGSQMVYVTSGDGLQIVDLTDPENPVVSETIFADGAEITSTAVQPGSGVIAIAVVNATDKTLPGSVQFHDSTGALLNTVTVGALPDQIVFTRDGSKLLVANEGQSADPEENDPLIFPNPEGSVSIIDLSGGVASATGVIADFNAFDSQADDLRAAGVRLFPNVTATETLVDEDDELTVSQDLEPEAIAITEDDSFAYITLQENNAVAVLDIANATFTEILPLGLKDHSSVRNALDASNRDVPGESEEGRINIQPWPIFGMYMPDHIKTYEVGGETYFIIANEGDGRAVDETRGGSLNVDETAFPDAALFDDDNLGRLKFSNVDGDVDGDGDIDVLHSFGARSFSIYDSAGNQIYDSGSDFEVITAALVPELFNSDESDPGEFDARSDDKGPEPEGLTTGVVNGQTYAFIGLERVGGIMVYNVTDVNKVCLVQYLSTAGDQAPEGLAFVPASESPIGTPLLLVTNEASNTLTTYEFNPPFTLELFHLADQEASVNAVGDEPRLSAILNKLRADDLGADGLPDNSLTLSSGDAIIPGLFYEASAAVYGSAGIADIQIQNELGIQAVALGNHEFDFGTEMLAGLIDGSAPGAILDSDYAGTSFPYLSGNLNFATDAAMAPLVTADHQPPVGGRVAATTVIEVNGEKIGVVAATTPTLASISSSGSIGITPAPFAGSPSSFELDELAAVIQEDVDALLATDASINKVILLAHMQRIDIEQALATRLREVDIIVAGGSNTRLFDEDDRIRSGDSYQGAYPLMSHDADGQPVAIVNTDGSYKYLGRLVIDFDATGTLIPESYDPTISGAYATDEQGVAELEAAAIVDPEIQGIADAIEAQIIATDGNYFGVTTEFLNGNRSGGPTDGVRTQETNLGNLTADANLAAAREVDPTVVMSIKNGGGIRASIGETVVLPGDTVASRLAPAANPLSGRPVGGISQNAIQAALAFNNNLILLTLTKAEIVALLEHGIGAIPGVSGQFSQVGGVRFSYDQSTNPRIVNAVLVNEAGEVTEVLAMDGQIVGDADETFRIVTLDFLSRPNFDNAGNFIGAGDGYPFPNYNTDPGTPEAPQAVASPEQVARINPVVITRDEVRTGVAQFADDYSEQDALAEYLVSRFPESTPYEEADLPPMADLRIQSLGERQDEVLGGVSLAVFSEAFGEHSDNDQMDLLFEYAYGLNPGADDDILQLGENGEVLARGGEFFDLAVTSNGVSFTANFLRRKDFARQGLIYTPQYTSQNKLGTQWYDAAVVPVVVGEDGEMEVVQVEFPIFTPDAEKAQFFRMKVDTAAVPEG